MRPDTISAPKGGPTFVGSDQPHNGEGNDSEGNDGKGAEGASRNLAVRPLDERERHPGRAAA